ncbi:MAG: hypothetical protein ACYDH1_04230 [Anaerolineaceae bacterium]
MEQSDSPIKVPTEKEKKTFDSGNQGNKRNLVLLILAIIILLGLIVFSVVLLFRADLETTSRIRDIFIIFMALQSLVLGIAIIILIIQLATLINVFKNEIKPILETTNETLRNLRGTTSFISNNLVEPVIKMNEYSAGFKKFMDILIPRRKK